MAGWGAQQVVRFKINKVKTLAPGSAMALPFLHLHLMVSVHCSKCALSAQAIEYFVKKPFIVRLN